jgi:Na+/H+-dicarboxylate symporter
LVAHGDALGLYGAAWFVGHLARHIQRRRRVAGSAIVVLVSTLAATGTVPVAAVGIILGVHRLMSSAFVAVNVLGNALATIVIASWEGGIDRKVLTERLELGPA